MLIELSNIHSGPSNNFSSTDDSFSGNTCISSDTSELLSIVSDLNPILTTTPGRLVTFNNSIETLQVRPMAVAMVYWIERPPCMR